MSSAPFSVLHLRVTVVSDKRSSLFVQRGRHNTQHNDTHHNHIQQNHKKRDNHHDYAEGYLF